MGGQKARGAQLDRHVGVVTAAVLGSGISGAIGAVPGFRLAKRVHVRPERYRRAWMTAAQQGDDAGQRVGDLALDLQSQTAEDFNDFSRGIEFLAADLRILVEIPTIFQESVLESGSFFNKIHNTSFRSAKRMWAQSLALLSCKFYAAVNRGDFLGSRGEDETAKPPAEKTVLLMGTMYINI